MLNTHEIFVELCRSGTSVQDTISILTSLGHNREDIFAAWSSEISDGITMSAKKEPGYTMSFFMQYPRA